MGIENNPKNTYRVSLEIGGRIRSVPFLFDLKHRTWGHHPPMHKSQSFLLLIFIKLECEALSLQRPFLQSVKHSILIILFIVHSFKPIVPYVEYAFNYDYISTVLCVNKEKPKLNCNGKCYLAKMLAESESNGPEKGVPAAQLDLLFIPLYFQEAAAISLSSEVKEYRVANIAFLKSNYAIILTDLPLKPPVPFSSIAS